MDLVLVFFPFSDPRHKEFPYSRRAQTPHRINPSVPMVEIGRQVDASPIRRPNSELHPFYALNPFDVRSQHRIEFVMAPFVEQKSVDLADPWQEGVRVV